MFRLKLNILSNTSFYYDTLSPVACENFKFSRVREKVWLLRQQTTLTWFTPLECSPVKENMTTNREGETSFRECFTIYINQSPVRMLLCERRLPQSNEILRRMLDGPCEYHMILNLVWFGWMTNFVMPRSASRQVQVIRFREIPLRWCGWRSADYKACHDQSGVIQKVLCFHIPKKYSFAIHWKRNNGIFHSINNTTRLKSGSLPESGC